MHGHFRWSGPSTESVIAVPASVTGSCAAAVHVLFAIEPDTLSAMTVLVNGRPVVTAVEPTEAHTWLIRFRLEPLAGEREFEITLRVRRTMRPFDISPSMDRRWLGVAVNWIELQPD